MRYLIICLFLSVFAYGAETTYDSDPLAATVYRTVSSADTGDVGSLSTTLVFPLNSKPTTDLDLNFTNTGATATLIFGRGVVNTKMVAFTKLTVTADSTIKNYGNYISDKVVFDNGGYRYGVVYVSNISAGTVNIYVNRH